jgi:hypothetical protein
VAKVLRNAVGGLTVGAVRMSNKGDETSGKLAAAASSRTLQTPVPILDSQLKKRGEYLKACAVWEPIGAVAFQADSNMLTDSLSFKTATAISASCFAAEAVSPQQRNGKQTRKLNDREKWGGAHELFFFSVLRT